MKKLSFKIILLLVSIIFIKPVFATNYVVPKDKIIVKPYDFSGIGPGDRLLIPAGERGPIRFQGFIGTKDKPIIIINSGGKAQINGNGTYAGIWLYGCEHVKLTGTGYSNIEYGIEVYNAKTKGVCASEYTRYFEIDHIEVHTIGAQGIFSQTNYAVRETWTQYGTYIHHNYIHDVGGSGMYIGNSNWDTDGRPELKGVEISYNIVKDTGTIGIQLGSATEDVSVHHNIVKDTVKELNPMHNAGYRINAGTVGDWYNNIMLRSRGHGFYIRGLTGLKVYNNIIADSGYNGFTDTSDGIRWQKGSGEIYNNTIVNSGYDGIQCGSSASGTIHENLVVGYGNNGISNFLAAKTKNITLSSVLSAKFRNASADDYRITDQSPAVNSGSLSGYAPLDYNGVSRPQQGISDVGAYEYTDSRSLNAPTGLKVTVSQD